MSNYLKKYWILILIIIIGINFLGFYFVKESTEISDALEHTESAEIIENLKRKDFFYTSFLRIVLILDGLLILFLPYLIIKSVKKFNLSKK